MPHTLRQSGIWLLVFGMLSAVVLLASPQYTSAVDTLYVVPAAPNPQQAIVTCSPSIPIVTQGGTVEVFVWAASASGELLPSKMVPRWSTTSGRIHDIGSRFVWRLAEATLGEHTATVSIEIPGSGTSECVLTVIVKADTEQTFPIDERGQKERVAGRGFLLPNKKEDSGYGLYSYLLFATSPGIKQKERSLKVLEAFFEKIIPISELNLHFMRSELNVFYVPVKKQPTGTLSLSQLASFVLENYDYARAKRLLANLPATQQVNLTEGLYFVSSKSPLSGAASPHSLIQELHPSVPAHVAWEWIRYFMLVSSQQHSWGETALAKLRLKMRVIVANIAVGLPEVQKSLDNWIRLAQGSY